MREEIVKYLACPHRNKNEMCAGALVLDVVFADTDSGGQAEVVEGYLKCRSCGNRFPIFFGIPVLVSDRTGFFRENISHLKILSKQYGPINKKMIEDAMLLLSEKMPKNRRPSSIFITRKESLEVMKRSKDGFFVNQYDNLSEVIGVHHPLFGPLVSCAAVSPYSVLGGFLESHLRTKNGLAMEVGCNAGGFLRVLSSCSKFVFGVDSDFLELFYASCILKHFPFKREAYPLGIIGGKTEKRPLRVEKYKNVTLIAAKAENLPIKESRLSIVVSNNLFDLLDDPLASLKDAQRLLRRNGLFLFSCCYGAFWPRAWKRMHVKRNQKASERVEEVVGRLMKILDVRDHVPWLVRYHERGIGLYDNHCLCAKK